MRRQAPPLEATEAFLAAAHAASFRAAADAIALSPSAFSRRIQMLEHFVGVALFDRSGTNIALTAAGTLYLAQIEPALETIRSATAAMRDRSRGRVIRLVTSHSFAVGWLLSRMPALERAHGIEISLAIGRDAHKLSSGAADLAIWGGLAANVAFERDDLFEMRAIPVSGTCSTSGARQITSVDELCSYRLLAAQSPTHVWQRWLEHWSHNPPQEETVTRFDTLQLVYEAAASGLGIALAIPVLADRYIADARLQPHLGPPLPVGLDYSLYYATADVRRRPVVRDFRDWLLAEIAGSETRFNRWANPTTVPA